MTRNRKLWLPSMVGKICIFTFLLSVLILVLYIVGNYQSFLESTISFLIQAFRFISLSYLFFFGYYLALQILRAKLKMRVSVRKIVLGFLGSIFLVSCVIFFEVIISLITIHF